MGLGQAPFGSEIVFAVSLTVIVLMLKRVAGKTDPATRVKIAIAALLIFLFRAAPSAGIGYSWFTMDVLGFDEAFFGTLSQIGAGLALVAAWVLSDAITRQPVERVLLWLVIAGAIVSLPGLGLTFGIHNLTESMFGFGARSIAIVDAAAASPLAQISMIPMLTLIAINAPSGHRAIWFALMASLMNLAISAGELQTKYLNLLFSVDRGHYANLPWLYSAALVIGTAVPLIAIAVLGRRLR
jgi:BT1 family